jgi:DNA-binding Lrp family transcriptional regulator
VSAGFSDAAAKILVALSVNGETTQRDLERITGIKSSTVSLTVKRLVETGVINRRKIIGSGDRSLLAVTLAAPLSDVAERIVRGGDKMIARSFFRKPRSGPPHISVARRRSDPIMARDCGTGKCCIGCGDTGCPDRCDGPGEECYECPGHNAGLVALHKKAGASS